MSCVDGSVGSWLLDASTIVALRCLEQEPSTSSALDQKQPFGLDQLNVRFAPIAVIPAEYATPFHRALLWSCY